jgi:hypothetical protein
VIADVREHPFRAQRIPCTHACGALPFTLPLFTRLDDIIVVVPMRKRSMCCASTMPYANAAGLSSVSTSSTVSLSLLSCSTHVPNDTSYLSPSRACSAQHTRRGSLSYRAAVSVAGRTHRGNRLGNLNNLNCIGADAGREIVAGYVPTNQSGRP